MLLYMGVADGGLVTLVSSNLYNSCVNSSFVASTLCASGRCICVQGVREIL